MRLSLAASTAALAACLSAGSALADDSSSDVTAWRLFVAHHSEPKVTVIDALDGTVLDSLSIGAPGAALHRSRSGAAVFAVQGEAGTVAVIGSGISFDDHGDHADIDVDDAGLVGVEVKGQRPSHFVEHDGQFAAFFDGEGVARVFKESEVLDGHLHLREVSAGAPHHGVIIPFASHDLVSVPDADDTSKPPVGVRILDRKGNQVGETVSCVGLHGEATSGNIAALGGCADGILIVRTVDGVPVVEPLSFTEGMPEGRVSTLVGGRGLQYFLGNFGPDKVVLIDPAETEAFRIIDLPTRRVHFAVDPVRARFAYVFTEDGQLHRIDAIDGAVTASLRLTDPYSMDGHWSDPRPRIAVAGDRIVVTDPLAGKLHLVNATSFSEEGEIEVEGTPFNIVAVGGTGTAHGEDGDHGHDHAGDSHSHDHGGDGHSHGEESRHSHDHGHDHHDHD